FRILEHFPWPRGGNMVADTRASLLRMLETHHPPAGELIMNLTRPPEHRPPLLTRRQLLQVGGGSILGLGLPQFLQASVPQAAARSRRGSEKSCIFIVQYGGASHIDSWDPKPEAPETVRGPYKPIATRVPGLRIGELLPQLAGLADRYCLIRS